MSPADSARIDSLAEDAVSDLTRAEVFKAGREFIEVRARLVYPDFAHWLWQREVARITEQYYEARI